MLSNHTNLFNKLIPNNSTWDFKTLKIGGEYFIRSLTGKIIKINLEPSDTIERREEKIQDKERILPDQQRIIFEGKQFKENRTIAELEIPNGSSLHMVLALRWNI